MGEGGGGGMGEEVWMKGEEVWMKGEEVWVKGEEEVWVKGERREDNIIVQDKGRRGGMWVKGEKERGGGRKGGGRSIEG